MVPSSSGVEVATYDLGGSGPNLFLCHATGFCGGVWLPLASHLLAHFRCITFDFRAHGRSLLPEGVTMKWDGLVDDQIAVMEHYAPEGNSLAVGHSLGGGMIALTADRRPDLFSKAWAFEPILFSKGPVASGDASPDIAKAARRRRSRFDSREEVLNRYSSKMPMSFLRPDVLEAYVRYGFRDTSDGGVELCCSPENEASLFEHHATGAFEAAGRIEFPYSIGASGDGMVPSQQTRRAAQTHPNLTLVDYPELNHFGPLQDPAGLAKDITGWFSE